MSRPEVRDERAALLGRLRQSLGVAAGDADRREAVRQRLSRHPAGTIPARTAHPEGWVALFTKALQAQGVTVQEAADGAEAVAAIAAYLRNEQLAPLLRLGADQRLAALPWQAAPELERRFGPAEPDDPVGLSCAFAGAAETGTLFLGSGADNPTTLNFLPETHIVVIEKADIVGPYETAWARLRAVYGPGSLPRAVNLVSGPSRTADIEQTLIRGAHGPRRLFVVILDR